jgi:hypothetical protein
MSQQLDKWLVDAFRCATMTKDDKLENEIFFINQARKRLYEEKLLA